MIDTINPKTILAFDWGEKRIGVAIKRDGSFIAKGLTVIDNDSDFWSSVIKIITQYNPDLLIVGRPLNLEGKETKQTQLTKDFADKLAKRTHKKVVMQDETLSSQEAKKRLNPNLNLRNQKRLINQLAAEIILEDYLNEE